ncbi:cytochrome c2 precursor [bacterium BMS3Bbin10]|nr:cytochrome c2 precursor [bacterium BMS3Bbin10]
MPGRDNANPGRFWSQRVLMRVSICALGALLLLSRPLWRGAEFEARAEESDAAVTASAAKPDAPKDASAPGGQGDLSLRGHGGPVHSIKLNSAKTRALTGSFDYSMMLWDLSARPPKQIRRFDKHDGWVKAVALHRDGRRALSAGGGDVWLWDLATGEALYRFKGHKAEISALALSPDGKWAASASSDRTVRLWNLETRRAGPVLKGHKGPVNAVAFSADGKTVFTAGYDGTIRSWASAGGAFKRILYRHGFGINAMARLPGKKDLLVFGALDGRALVIDARTGERVHRFKALQGPFLAIALQEKPGLLALSGFEKKGGDIVGFIHVFRLGDWAPIEEYENPRGPIWAMDFGAIGATIYYGGKDDRVTVWQVSPRKEFETIAGPMPRRFEVNGTADQGELQFVRKCSLCHTLTSDGGNRAGPTLYRLFGRRAGTLPGYPYSDTLKNADIIWSAETIELLFGLGPSHYLPGTKMPLQKISDPKKREALIAYLKTASDAKSEDSSRKSDETGKDSSKEQ